MPRNPKNNTYQNVNIAKMIGNDSYVISYWPYAGMRTSKFVPFDPANGFFRYETPVPGRFAVVASTIRARLVRTATGISASIAPWDVLPKAIPSSIRDRILVPACSEVLEDYLNDRRSCRNEAEHRRLLNRVRFMTVILVLDCIRVILLEKAIDFARWFVQAPPGV